MSLHYEVMFSCYLLDDTPVEVIEELRWHLGLPGGRLATADAGDAYPLLRPDPDSRLPGGDVASLQRQLRGHPAGVWGLFARNLWLDDDLGAMTTILDLISPYVAEDGYGGCFRETHDIKPTVFVFHQRGYHTESPARGTIDRTS
jgi:hypothetical protein